MTQRRFVCPFCPLHCDDLDANAMSQKCSLLAIRLADAIEHDSRSSGTDESAMKTARQWVAGAESIAVTGAAVDLETARAVCRFLERTGAIWADFRHEGAAYREAFSRDGMILTTLGDAAAAHQSVILIGDPAASWPRLIQRLAGVAEIYQWQRTDRLADRLAEIRMRLRGKAIPVNADDPDPAVDADLAHTLRTCQTATSVVFVIAPQAIDRDDERLFWKTLGGMLAELNQRIRCTLLRFDDSATLRNVAAWTGQTRTPPETVATSSAYDLVVHLVPWDQSPAGPTEFLSPTSRCIRIGVPASGAGTPAGSVCHLATSSPGIGRPGVVIRGDGSVTLPLGAITKTKLASPAQVLELLALERVLPVVD
jgi:hypothetical protein